MTRPTPIPEGARELVMRLRAARARRATESTIQTGVHALLIAGKLGFRQIDNEMPCGGGRIDILADRVVFEVKRDLRAPAVRAAAAQQVVGYLQQRHAETGVPHVGVITDGTIWMAYSGTRSCGYLSINGGKDTARLLAWLNDVRERQRQLATATPTPGHAGGQPVGDGLILGYPTGQWVVAGLFLLAVLVALLMLWPSP